ncbi:MAG: hypothetical protein V1489_02230 [Candidatus Liptonbacteria bacterium]
MDSQKHHHIPLYLFLMAVTATSIMVIIRYKGEISRPAGLTNVALEQVASMRSLPVVNMQIQTIKTMPVQSKNLLSNTQFTSYQESQSNQQSQSDRQFPSDPRVCTDQEGCQKLCLDPDGQFYSYPDCVRFRTLLKQLQDLEGNTPSQAAPEAPVVAPTAPTGSQSVLRNFLGNILSAFVDAFRE